MVSDKYKELRKKISATGLNPCFSGRWSLTANAEKLLLENYESAQA